MNSLITSGFLKSKSIWSWLKVHQIFSDFPFIWTFLTILDALGLKTFLRSIDGSTFKKKFFPFSLLPRLSSVIHQGKFSGYWGDLHGQSGESIGKIQIFNDYSLVDLPRDQNNEVKNKLKKIKVRN